MNLKRRLFAVCAANLITVSTFCQGAEADNSSASRPDKLQAGGREVRITVDPRVELLSLIFRLAGNPEYNRARVGSYAADADKQFEKWKNEPVIKLAQKLRAETGVSYDACMGLAIYLTDIQALEPRVSLTPWPDSLDSRWNPKSISNFVAEAREFVHKTGFQEFLKSHASLYSTTESRMRDLVMAKGHFEWFTEYFGERSTASLNIVLGLLNGGNNYGPRFRQAAGIEELYCILGVWKTDSEGLPVFTEDMLEVVAHEFGHSFANPLIERHEKEFQSAGRILYDRVADEMKSQAYGNSTTMLKESLVRGNVTRFVLHYKGKEQAEKAIREEQRRGFLWTDKLFELLGEYEAHRDQYPTLEQFVPQLVSFFDNYAKNLPPRAKPSQNPNAPKIVSMIPANGATDVDSGLAEIRVTFDRAMKDRSWSICEGSNSPKTTGQPHYNQDRTIWTVPVKLNPGQEYEYGINCPAYRGFKSDDGVALEPVMVKFRTAGK